MDQPLKIMIVAGEASGDKLAGALVGELNAVVGPRPVEWFGAAGITMREAGVEPVVNSDEMSVVGVAEIIRAGPMFYRIFRKLKALANERKPDVVVLVDLPDFNLKLAKTLKKAGHKVVYYVSPQLWAWRSYRRRTIAKYVDLLLTILPFENEWYAEHRISNVEFVGNPHATEVKADRSRSEFLADLGLDPDAATVVLMPGSRTKEVERIFPVMADAAASLVERVQGVQFIVALANAHHRAYVDRTNNSVFKVVVGDTYNALAAADAAAIKCGTGTLEAGIIGTPMVNVYKTSALNYLLIRPLVHSKYYSLVDLVADERIAEELIQKELTPERLADELIKLLDPETNAALRERLKIVNMRLGPGGASRRAAEAIVRTISDLS